MLASMFRFSGAALLVLLSAQPMARAGDEVVAYAVRAVTTKGAEFSGRVPRTNAFDDLLKEGDSIDLASVDPHRKLKLAGVNGLNGSATFAFGGLKSVRVEGRLTEQDLKQLRESRASSRRSRLEREKIRLRGIDSRREQARQARRQRDEREQERAGGPALSEEHQQWIDRFPPDAGWIPAKKAQIYYQTVILDNRAPTDDERAWLDAYDQWKPAYDAWLVLEKEKLKQEQAAKEAAAQGDESVEQPKGDARSDRSGTSASKGSDIDPDAPTPEEQEQLPPAIDPDTEKPERISKEAPKPEPLKPYAVKPEPLKDGSRP